MNSASTSTSLEPAQQFPPGATNTLKSYDLDVMRSLRMHKLLFLSVTAIVFVVLAAFGLSRQPYYQTEALIYVQPMKSKLVTDPTEGSYDQPRYETYIQQQLQTIVRSDIMAEALSKPSTYSWRFPGEPEQAAIARLQHSLKVDRVSGSYELSIDLAGSNPVAIANVVNAVASAYIRGERSDELAQSDQQLQILEDERKRVSNDLTADHREQAELSVALGVADTSGETADPYDVQLADLRAELGKAVAAHEVAAAEASSLSDPQSSEAIHAADELASTDPGLAALKQSIGARRSLLESQMSGLTPKNPLYQQDQQELQRLDQSLTSMETEVRSKATEQLRRKLELESRRTSDIADRLSRQLSQKTAVATGATPELQHAADLAADITRLQARYNEVDNAINSIELEKDTAGLVHILTDAVPPLAPKNSTKRLIIGAALPFGIFVGLIAVVVMRKIDPRVYGGHDVAQVVHFYPIAILPHANSGEPPVRDEFLLRLVAGIDQIHRSDDAKTFVFTAASPESSIADLVSSLASSMEKLGYDVVTVKASDLITNQNLAQDIATAREAQPTPPVIEGNSHENFVVRNIQAITRDADILFVEALPLLSSSEAEFVGRLSDVAILVAESGQTTRQELRNAIALVKRLRLPGLATVLSDVKLSNADSDFISAVHTVERRLTAAA